MNIAQRLIASITFAGLAYTALRPWFWISKKWATRVFFDVHEILWEPTILQAAGIVFTGASFFLLSTWTKEILEALTGKGFVEKRPLALPLFSLGWVVVGCLIIRAVWLQVLSF